MIESLIKAQAYGLGFDLVGIAKLGPAETAPAFDAWLERGYEGEMAYMSRTAAKRRDSRLPFPTAKSAIVVGMDYGGREPSGPVARYARGDDYHEVLLERLQSLHHFVEAAVGSRVTGKAYVDTGPILERDLGRRAGLGWFGKNTMLINPQRGSFFFLAELVLDLELDPDAPFASDHCGTCRRCIDACPTGAIVEERVLDSNRCISYLTIEIKGEIPGEWHAAIGGHVYGCDVCQEVCPWNEKFSVPVREDAFRTRTALEGRDAPALAREILSTDDEHFRSAFRASPMKRAKLRGLRRNAAIVLGNVVGADG
ncbi:MAG TPA: tRNA epoxyqueuosine(34) reductase QueG [Gemmatimonadaceae bacterium]|nr:tRNA epoxyqueuosine(34) reductase QueG [Gemmatimonadaceae bacterium]